MVADDAKGYLRHSAIHWIINFMPGVFEVLSGLLCGNEVNENSSAIQVYLNPATDALTLNFNMQNADLLPQV